MDIDDKFKMAVVISGIILVTCLAYKGYKCFC